MKAEFTVFTFLKKEDIHELYMPYVCSQYTDTYAY